MGTTKSTFRHRTGHKTVYCDNTTFNLRKKNLKLFKFNKNTARNGSMVRKE